MNPASKGWLKAFINTHYLNVYNCNCLKEIKPANDELFLYRIIQNTGLIYGLPSKFFIKDPPHIKEWNDKEKLRLIIAESFLNIGFCKCDKIPRLPDLNSINKLLDSVIDFYSVTYPDLTTKIKSVDSFEKLEKIIEKRINLKYKISKSFWTALFQNSMVFLDLVFYTRWLNSGEIVNEERQILIKLQILKIVAISTRVNGPVLREEKRVFDYFLQSAQLPEQYASVAKGFLSNIQGLNEVDFSYIDSWLLKKFSLEISLLTQWSDRLITENEKTFIYDLSNALDLPDEDTESSILSVESFVLNNFDKIKYLKNRSDYMLLSDSLTRRLLKMVFKNKTFLVQELRESKELVELLAKSGRTKLTDEEKKKVKEQILDILRSIPSFAIFMAPAGSILLPLLLKILPEELIMPSSFKNKKEE